MSAPALRLCCRKSPLFARHTPKPIARIPRLTTIFISQMKAKTKIYIPIIILVSSLFLVVTGSPILNKPFIKDSTLPLGTLISWIGIIALTLTIYCIFNKIHRSNSKNHKILRYVFKGIISLASIWGFIGFLFANNWALTFQNHDKFRGSIDASLFFWIYTATLVLFPILLIIILLLISMAKKLMKRPKHML